MRCAICGWSDDQDSSISRLVFSKLTFSEDTLNLCCSCLSILANQFASEHSDPAQVVKDVWLGVASVSQSNME